MTVWMMGNNAFHFALHNWMIKQEIDIDEN